MFFIYLGSFIISILASDEDITGYVKFCILAYFIFISIAGCWIFNNMRTKKQRIAFNMLPATHLEKYLSRYLYVTVFWIIGGIAAFIASDLVGSLLRCFFGYGKLFEGTATAFEFCFQTPLVVANTTLEGKDYIPLFFWAVFGQASYILGGSFFRRNPLILTWCVQMLIGILASSFSLTVTDKTITMYILRFDFLDAEWVFTSTVVPIVLAILMYVLSYKIFCRMQVISNKWINV